MYETAIKCAINDDLRSEWEEYLEQTRHHEQVVTTLLEEIGVDPATETPGRAVVRNSASRSSRRWSRHSAPDRRRRAQLVAGECVVNAETKDHLNWELMRTAAEKAPKTIAEAITRACDEVEDEEDEHLYHSMGWTRELWIESLGLPAVLPPPEEQKDVKTAIGAARAKNAREDMTG